MPESGEWTIWRIGRGSRIFVAVPTSISLQLLRDNVECDPWPLIMEVMNLIIVDMWVESFACRLQFNNLLNNENRRNLSQSFFHVYNGRFRTHSSCLGHLKSRRPPATIVSLFFVGCFSRWTRETGFNEMCEFDPDGAFSWIFNWHKAGFKLALLHFRRKIKTKNRKCGWSEALGAGVVEVDH
jgi:hypothetical protein